LYYSAQDGRGAPLSGLAVNVTSNFFLIGLSAVEADLQRMRDRLGTGQF
jgi:hypothetical protein